MTADSSIIQVGAGEAAIPTLPADAPARNGCQRASYDSRRTALTTVVSASR
ncbi:hypothetical protein [Candidatus Binatus sp.]|uniref:hypothetical protein n=1 Tax=Candidatus Binatus sp. TaxID=2811406 RepID=UPI003CC661C0